MLRMKQKHDKLKTRSPYWRLYTCQMLPSKICGHYAESFALEGHLSLLSLGCNDCFFVIFFIVLNSTSLSFSYLLQGKR